MSKDQIAQAAITAACKATKTIPDRLTMAKSPRTTNYMAAKWLITEFLRKERVVSTYLEFFGEGAANLTIGDRATISNMTPEYGAATQLFFQAKSNQYAGNRKSSLSCMEFCYKLSLEHQKPY